MQTEIKILFFAQARQIVGHDSITISVGDACTIRDLKTQLIAIQPNLTDLVARSAFAIDQNYATDDSIVTAGVEVALIPPVSGG